MLTLSGARVFVAETIEEVGVSAGRVGGAIKHATSKPIVRIKMVNRIGIFMGFTYSLLDGMVFPVTGHEGPGSADLASRSTKSYIFHNNTPLINNETTFWLRLTDTCRKALAIPPRTSGQIQEMLNALSPMNRSRSGKKKMSRQQTGSAALAVPGVAGVVGRAVYLAGLGLHPSSEYQCRYRVEINQ